MSCYGRRLDWIIYSKSFIGDKFENIKNNTMTKEDHTEVGEVVHSIVGGYHAKVDAQNIVTNAALIEIKDHLKELNNKVASHEKIINQNLPHNIAHCTQTDTIQEIRDNLISRRAVITAFVVGIPLAAVIIGGILKFV